MDGGDVGSLLKTLMINPSSSNLALAFTTLTAGHNNSRKVALGDMFAELKWLSVRIGQPFAIWDHLIGADVSPIDSALYRYIKLTAGEDGTGEYNEGALTSERFSGTAPLVIATAVIDYASSPMDGQTVSLINTERRFLRAGSSGAVEADAFQGHYHRTLMSSSGAVGTAPQPAATKTVNNGLGTDSAGAVQPVTDGTSGTPRTANETRGKNIGATYYMRIR
tara:strand:+ start:50 stop:715 length:666 start_codon:yes stop_codon:yes gene_type:complete